jgi:WD40 repeat protein
MTKAAMTAAFSHHVSTWGVAMHGELRLLAVSNNNHEIRLIDLMDHAAAAASDSEDDAAAMPDVPEFERLVGHAHNIPCIDVSACGQWLVSASIDGTCRMWRRASGTCIAVAKPSRLWYALEGRHEQQSRAAR